MSSEWKIKPLGNISSMYQPKTISQEEMIKNGEYVVYGANGIIGRYDKFNHELPQLLVTCRGATCGTINISQPYSWITGNSMVIQPKKETVILDYLKYYLSQPLLMSQVITGAAQPQITRANLSLLNVKYPTSIVKQQEIAAILDKTSELIEKRKEQLRELDTLAESVFYDMFGDPVTNENKWNATTLNNLFTITSSKRIYQSQLTETGIPFYKISDLVRKIDGQELSNTSYISQSLYNELVLNDLVPRESDILITSRGTLGRCYIVAKDDRFYFQDGMISWLKNNTNIVLNTYLVFLFNTTYVKMQINSDSNGATVNYLSLDNLKKLQILIPPLNLQNQFASIIEKIEIQKVKVKETLKESENLFQRLMQDMFNPQHHEK